MCEWLKFGATDQNHQLIDTITHVFNKVIHGSYPTNWAASAIVPVPKGKGVKTDMDNYRGIAVGSVFGKIFSLCLLHRLDEWAEYYDLRAQGQFGFRKERGTSEATFTLNTIIDGYKSNHKSIYVAFVDFRKAYDCINREALWNCLSKLGVSDSFLKILRSMYTSVSMRVRMNGKLGEEFISMI